jgi:hypothetical protein
MRKVIQQVQLLASVIRRCSHHIRPPCLPLVALSQALHTSSTWRTLIAPTTKFVRINNEYTQQACARSPVIRGSPAIRMERVQGRDEVMLWLWEKHDSQVIIESGGYTCCHTKRDRVEPANVMLGVRRRQTCRTTMLKVMKPSKWYMRVSRATRQRYPMLVHYFMPSMLFSRSNAIAKTKENKPMPTQKCFSKIPRQKQQIYMSYPMQ